MRNVDVYRRRYITLAVDSLREDAARTCIHWRRDSNVDAFDGVPVGQWVGEDLHYRGIVEWGFRAADVLTLLHKAQHSRQRVSPFVDPPRMRGAVWLAPRLRADVSYADIVTGKLRAPSWRGLVRR